MSRGHGVVQRFILDYLAAGRPEPNVRSALLSRGRPERIGHPLRAIAAAYAGVEAPDRTTMASLGRAMATLRAAGLIEIRYKWDLPHLRLARRPVRSVTP